MKARGYSLRACLDIIAFPQGLRGRLRESDVGPDQSASTWTPVHLGVFGQVVAPGELLVAHGALVRLDSRVRPPVARQLVGPREPL